MSRCRARSRRRPAGEQQRDQEEVVDAEFSEVDEARKGLMIAARLLLEGPRRILYRRSGER